MNTVVIFDFDGVLIDSLDEVAITAYNVIAETLLTSLGELPPNYLALFRKNRHLVQPAGDFIPFARWCLANERRSPGLSLAPELFAELRRRESIAVAERGQMLFRARARFSGAHAGKWLELHRPYEPLWTWLKGAVDEQGPYILTHKNRAAVFEICGHFGLAISHERVFTGDYGRSKIENLKNILESLSSPPLWFVDDSLGNLRELVQAFSTFDLTLILATWGYIGPEDTILAERAGIRAYSQGKFLEELSR